MLTQELLLAGNVSLPSLDKDIVVISNIVMPMGPAEFAKAVTEVMRRNRFSWQLDHGPRCKTTFLHVLCLNLSSTKYNITPKKAFARPAKMPWGQLQVWLMLTSPRATVK
jgi:hypothetical protein